MLSWYSSASPGIRSNSRVLPVASISPSVQVCPTIHRSFAPIRSPAASSSARRLPYLMSTGTSRGSTGSAPQQVFDLPLQLRGPLLGAPVAQFRRDDGTGEDHLWAYSMWRAAGPLGSRSSALIVGVQPITVHRTSSDLSGASATSGNWSSAPSGSSCRHLADNSAMSRGPITSSIKRDWSGMVVVYRRPQTLQPTFAVD